MSREIKFRAWVGSENTSFIDMPSHYEYDVILKDGCYADVESGWDIHGVFSLVPIEQYTGLKDKNGKEIYEGDIVKFVGGDQTPAEVVYQEGSYFIKALDDGTLFYDSKADMPCPFGWFETRWLEVIGNIHENPELLGGKK